LVELDEIFMATHTNKNGDWIDIRARETYVGYLFNFFSIYLFLHLIFLTFLSPNHHVGKLPRVVEGQTR